jgi:hypothetical protein
MSESKADGRCRLRPIASAELREKMKQAGVLEAPKVFFQQLS